MPYKHSDSYIQLACDININKVDGEGNIMQIKVVQYKLVCCGCFVPSLSSTNQTNDLFFLRALICIITFDLFVFAKRVVEQKCRCNLYWNGRLKIYR